MPYTNYTTELERLETLEFTSVDNLNQMLRQLDGIQFALQSQRTQGIAIVNDLVKETNIFSDVDRFPDRDAANHRAAVICLTVADWPFKFEQITTALNYKVPDVAQTNKDLASNSAGSQLQASNRPNNNNNNGTHDDISKCIIPLDERIRFEKAMKSFFTGVADIRRQITGATLTRRIFEHTYNLRWQNAVVPIEP